MTEVTKHMQEKIDLGIYDGCLRAEMEYQVGKIVNRGAIQEAEEATDALQPPEQLRDTEQSRYVDGRPVLEIQPLRAACISCAAVVSVDVHGGVFSRGCSVVTSGKCELFWMQSYPEDYEANMPEDGVLPCHAEIGCSAKVALGESVCATLVDGVCKVENAGKNWKSKGERQFYGSKKVLPEVMSRDDSQPM